MHPSTHKTPQAPTYEMETSMQPQPRIPEQPTTPPELAQSIDQACRWTFTQVVATEKSSAHAKLRVVLTAGHGHLESCDKFGRVVNLDAGQLWEALTENEESADLAPMIAACVWLGDLAAAKRAQ